MRQDAKTRINPTLPPSSNSIPHLSLSLTLFPSLFTYSVNKCREDYLTMAEE
ncbi:unnamed protein product [Dovyalis caffra]|uniref:Uncharacterized protein n=1 Tax=Dovyalis caffra TaxID=77055 RepID=A0AAV1QY07_9ROSI|nr:unnamed protein product [Dovyalis caffra]